MKSIEVVAAIITQPDGRILCTQRNKGPYSYISKKYEFPGGKIEIGESKEEADGEVSNMIAPVQSMIGDTLVLSWVYYDWIYGNYAG